MRVIDVNILKFRIHIVISDRNLNFIQLQFFNPDPSIDQALMYNISNIIENYQDLTDDQITAIIADNEDFKKCYQLAATNYGI